MRLHPLEKQTEELRWLLPFVRIIGAVDTSVVCASTSVSRLSRRKAQGLERLTLELSNVTICCTDTPDDVPSAD